ncbi:MAG TPA: hypothetical protein VI524_10195 [Anaerolineales bacterium]|nr:hypothetical protein [Anaerolineales bacterium]
MKAVEDLPILINLYHLIVMDLVPITSFGSPNDIFRRIDANLPALPKLYL